MFERDSWSQAQCENVCLVLSYGHLWSLSLLAYCNVVVYVFALSSVLCFRKVNDLRSSSGFGKASISQSKGFNYVHSLIKTVFRMITVMGSSCCCCLRKNFLCLDDSLRTTHFTMATLSQTQSTSSMPVLIHSNSATLLNRCSSGELRSITIDQRDHKTSSLDHWNNLMDQQTSNVDHRDPRTSALNQRTSTMEQRDHRITTLNHRTSTMDQREHRNSTTDNRTSTMDKRENGNSTSDYRTSTMDQRDHRTTSLNHRASTKDHRDQRTSTLDKRSKSIDQHTSGIKDSQTRRLLM